MISKCGNIKHIYFFWLKESESSSGKSREIVYFIVKYMCWIENVYFNVRLYCIVFHDFHLFGIVYD